MDRSERFKKAYEYLRFNGFTQSQKDLADRMQATAPNVSKALKGDSKFITDNFLRRFNEAFGELFNYQWLILGEGNMLKDGNEEEETPVQSETSRFLSLLEKKDEQIDRLLDQHDRLVALLEKETERTQLIISRAG